MTVAQFCGERTRAFVTLCQDVDVQGITFARLDQAWTASSVTGSTLKSVLDPGDTGKSVLDGRDASKFGSADGSSSDAGDDSSSGGGGGSFNWLGLLPLALASLRRRR